MTEEAETRPVVLVDVVDANGNVIASQVMDYEVKDFLRLRVDPEIAKGCTIEPVLKTS